MIQYILCVVGAMLCSQNDTKLVYSDLFTIMLDASPNGLNIFAPDIEEGGLGDGPRSIAVNSKGCIAIVNTLQGGHTSIKKYSDTGRYIGELSFPDQHGMPKRFWSIALSEEGNVFGTTGTSATELTCFDNLGNKKWGKTVDDGLDVTLCARNDGSVSITKGENQARVLSKTGEFLKAPGCRYLSPDPSVGGVSELRSPKGELMYKLSTATSGTVFDQPKAFVSDGKLKFLYLDENGYITSWRLVKADSPRVLQKGNEIVSDLVIGRHSPKGNLVALIKIPGPLSGSPVNAAVAPNGDVYFMVFDYNRVHIAKCDLSKCLSGYVESTFDRSVIVK